MSLIILWALGAPMTEGVDVVFDYLPKILDSVRGDILNLHKKCIALSARMSPLILEVDTESHGS